MYSAFRSSWRVAMPEPMTAARASTNQCPKAPRGSIAALDAQASLAKDSCGDGKCPNVAVRLRPPSHMQGAGLARGDGQRWSQ
eukprot:2888910-Pleurochrysis_carterae.AAC.1